MEENNGWADKRRMIIINFLVNNPKWIVFLISIHAPIISRTTNKIYKMLDDIVKNLI